MPASRPKILIADDDRLIMRMVVDLLEPEFDLTTVNDGEAAVAALEQEPVSAVLSDHMMPGLEGVEVLRRCISIQPNAARILMTASDRVQDMSDAINIARVHRFICKPIRALDVVGTIKGAIREVELERENELLVTELQLVIGQVRARERRLEEELALRDQTIAELRR